MRRHVQELLRVKLPIGDGRIDNIVPLSYCWLVSCQIGQTCKQDTQIPNLEGEA